MTRLNLTQLPLLPDDDIAGRVGQVLDGRPYVYACLDANRIVNLPCKTRSNIGPQKRLRVAVVAE